MTIRLGATPSGLSSAHLHHPPAIFFTGRMPFLPPNQQRQSTEGNRVRQQWLIYDGCHQDCIALYHGLIDS